jgi:hypothetical protein
MRVRRPKREDGHLRLSNVEAKNEPFLLPMLSCCALKYYDFFSERIRSDPRGFVVFSIVLSGKARL